MTQLRDYRDALASLLTTDATFIAAVQTALGQAVTNFVNSNRPLGEIAAGIYPCWVLEIGDGKAAPEANNSRESQTIGLSSQSFTHETHLALVWMDNNRDAAANARADLPYLLTQLLLRNPMPGNACELAVLTDWQPDRAVNHPTQIWRATVESLHTFPRAG